MEVNAVDGIKQLMSLIKQYRVQIFLAAIVGACTVLCSVGLLGASAVLISKAAIVPAMMELMIVCRRLLSRMRV